MISNTLPIQKKPSWTEKHKNGRLLVRDWPPWSPKVVVLQGEVLTLSLISLILVVLGWSFQSFLHLLQISSSCGGYLEAEGCLGSSPPTLIP